MVSGPYPGASEAIPSKILQAHCAPTPNQLPSFVYIDPVSVLMYAKMSYSIIIIWA